MVFGFQIPVRGSFRRMWGVVGRRVIKSRTRRRWCRQPTTTVVKIPICPARRNTGRQAGDRRSSGTNTMKHHRSFVHPLDPRVWVMVMVVTMTTTAMGHTQTHGWSNIPELAGAETHEKHHITLRPDSTHARSWTLLCLFLYSVALFLQTQNTHTRKNESNRW